ncbi:OmpP1/FadL family transporter [Carboxylicivirga taeanensis]|uniref:OmpP1/FadL family transporter n=1 Tax=Carboxylicivirga taeanensis TaxID=1416875 RepID=UPI003F6E3AA6
MKRIGLFCGLLMIGFQLFAEGYQVNLQGNRQVGMGHTGAGLVLGATSMHFNPGALSLMDKQYDFSLGGSFIFSKNTFQKQSPSVYEAKSDNPMGTPFYFYGATKVNDKLALGLSVTTPYGNSLKWGDDWDGNFLIQDISLQAIFVQPTVSYQITDKLGVGVGFMAVNGSVDLNKALPLQSSNGTSSANLSGNTWAYGFNAGISFLANEKLSFGLSYRSKVLVELEEGEATFSVPSSLYNDETGFPRSTNFKGELPLPANITFGVGYQVNDKLLLAADLQYVEWSAYQSLNFDFENNTPMLQDSHNVRDFENTMIYRLGAEYTLNEKIQFRGGIYYDSTPIAEDLLTPETPGTNKIGMSLGCGYQINDKLSLDASLLYIHGEKREDGYAPSNFYGTYYTNAVIPGIGVNYSF